MYRKKTRIEDQKVISANHYSRYQIENICNAFTDKYKERKMISGRLIEKIDIDDFVKNDLRCKVIYENISASADSIGYTSDGNRPLKVNRNGRDIEVIFPRYTIVIDKCLLNARLENRRRFTLAHEAGHVIKMMLCSNETGRFCHAGGSMVRDEKEMHERFSIKEVEANNFAACLLMPESSVMMLMKNMYGDEKIVMYDGDVISEADKRNVSEIAEKMGVSYAAMYYRLKNLDFFVKGDIEDYIEGIVPGDYWIEQR